MTAAAAAVRSSTGTCPVDSRSPAAPRASYGVCSIPSTWNVTFDSLLQSRVLLVPSSCLLVGVQLCPATSAASSAACSPQLLSIDYTSGQVVGSLPYGLSLTERPPSPAGLAQSSDEQLALSAVAGNRSSASGAEAQLCNGVRVARLTASSIELAWADRRCFNVSLRNTSDVDVQPASTVVTIPSGAAKRSVDGAVSVGGDLALWFDQSQVYDNGSIIAPASHEWRVYEASTGQLLDNGSSEWVLAKGYSSVLSHPPTRLVSLLAARPAPDGWDYSLLLYELTASGQLLLQRDATNDWLLTAWRALACETDIWVLHDSRLGHRWRGVDVSTGKERWAVSNDSFLAGEWPMQPTVQLPGASPRKPHRTSDASDQSGESSRLYVECSFGVAHPTDPSLFVMLLLGLNRTTGQADVMYGVLAVYDSATGQQLAMSELLGPAPILDNTVFCSSPPFAVADGSAIVVLVEDSWFALHPRTAVTLAMGVLPVLSSRRSGAHIPPYAWQLLSLDAGGRDGAAALAFSREGWLLGTTVSNATDAAVDAQLGSDDHTQSR